MPHEIIHCYLLTLSLPVEHKSETTYLNSALSCATSFIFLLKHAGRISHMRLAFLVALFLVSYCH